MGWPKSDYGVTRRCAQCDDPMLKGIHTCEGLAPVSRIPGMEARIQYLEGKVRELHRRQRR